MSLRWQRFYSRDDVALVVAVECEGVVADFDKAELLVERDGARVFLLDAEPDHMVAALLHFIEAGLHQLLGEAFAVPVAGDVQALDFAGGLAFHAGRSFIPAQLGAGHQFAGCFADRGFADQGFEEQRGASRVGNFGGLNAGAVTLPAMPVHVFGRIHHRKRVAERAFRQHGEGSGVTRCGGSRVWQGALREVNECRVAGYTLGRS